MATEHNLPPQPYKKFFGRRDSINKIMETLIEGGTFIASIDGVGGIGKTALAYYFCKEILLPRNQFDYIVWLTAKGTVFNPFSRDLKIKVVRSDFRGIEELIDTILSVIKYKWEGDFICMQNPITPQFLIGRLQTCQLLTQN